MKCEPMCSASFKLNSCANQFSAMLGVELDLCILLQDADLYGHGGHSPAFVPTFGSVLPTQMVSCMSQVSLSMASLEMDAINFTCSPTTLKATALQPISMSISAIYTPSLVMHACYQHVKQDHTYSKHGLTFVMTCTLHVGLVLQCHHIKSHFKFVHTHTATCYRGYWLRHQRYTVANT